MLKRLNSVRYVFIRSHFYGVFLTLLILLSVLLGFYVLKEPEWLTSQAIFFFIGLFIVVSGLVSIYVGFQSSGTIKEKLDGMTTMIRSLAQGNYNAKIYMNSDDEFGHMGEELNELAGKLQNQVKSLQRMADEKSEFAKTAHKAATIEERQRLARDLHDAVSQQLFALTMMAQATERLFDKDPDRAKTQLEEITSMALQAQTEMRALLLHLRPVHLSGEPLHEGIQTLIHELEEKCQMDFSVDLDDTVHLSDGTEEHLFRIVQEALSNILRHAEATAVQLSLTSISDQVFLHISDNGKGFHVNQDKKTSYGLKTMQERTDEIGGTLTLRSKPGEGTYIDIRIPNQEADVDE
ncbi:MULTISPECIES: sensor histidine kinase [Pontibacillus]|uniref:Sensor histidine kinase n=1 Tax=Pontibacillus chungwhensis TaxID=265426 RepID=A0ABY8V2X3_9BACI|nr:MULTISPECIES: sensor histidine kinase [Pontibacillus]MCD5324977.1 sensor histidine kinase [Pontibacillus sp. HN14]WIF98934.1 sensor histidine kinase [Pontibacillus chungwhensis]